MNTWQHWLNFILALWLIVSAYVGFDSTGMATNLTIVGIVMAVLALWGALQSGPATSSHRQSSMSS